MTVISRPSIDYEVEAALASRITEYLKRLDMSEAMTRVAMGALLSAVSLTLIRKTDAERCQATSP